jgi:hypothetical protein
MVGSAFILATNWTLVAKAGIGLELMAMTPDIFLDGLWVLGHLSHWLSLIIHWLGSSLGFPGGEFTALCNVSRDSFPIQVVRIGVRGRTINEWVPTLWIWAAWKLACI